MSDAAGVNALKLEWTSEHSEGDWTGARRRRKQRSMNQSPIEKARRKERSHWIQSIYIPWNEGTELIDELQGEWLKGEWIQSNSHSFHTTKVKWRNGIEFNTPFGHSARNQSIFPSFHWRNWIDLIAVASFPAPVVIPPYGSLIARCFIHSRFITFNAHSFRLAQPFGTVTPSSLLPSVHSRSLGRSLSRRSLQLIPLTRSGTNSLVTSSISSHCSCRAPTFGFASFV